MRLPAVARFSRPAASGTTSGSLSLPVSEPDPESSWLSEESLSFTSRSSSAMSPDYKRWLQWANVRLAGVTTSISEV